MSSFLNWNWAGENVQSEIKNGEHLSTESTLLLAGPSRLNMLSLDQGGLNTTNALLPIGLVQNWDVSQQQGLSRIFEIGSARAYFIPGRMIGGFSMSRVMMYGPSLLRKLYALAPLNEEQLGAFGTPLNTDPDSDGATVASIPEYNALFPQKTLQSVPGYGATTDEVENRDLFINLQSELFRVPFGLCFVMKDARDRPYGAFYLEDCMLEVHRMGGDANNVILAESVSGQFGRVNPIQLITTSGN